MWEFSRILPHHSECSNSLFHSFLKSDQSLFKNTIMMMTEIVDNILTDIIWMIRRVGDHFLTIFTKLDV